MANKPTNHQDLPLKRLRTATAELHTALEQIVDWNRVFSTADDYLRLLLGYRRVVKPADTAIARQLARFDNSPDEFEPNIRCQWLMQDCKAVQADVAVERFVDEFPDKIPGASKFESVETLASTIGVLYVLEGSSLGGQILSKQLQNSLGYTPVNGGSFFAGYGDQISRHWKNFSNWANRNLANESDVVQAEQAATYTFRCFMESFTELANE